MKTNLTSPTLSSLIVMLATAVLLILQTSRAVAAEALQGAASVLQKIAAAAEGAPKNAEPTSETARLQLDFARFTTNATALPADRAATEWLALLERLYSINPQEQMESSGDERLSVHSAVAALPPPAAWPALAKAIEARPAIKGPKGAREIGLKLLAHTLMDDRAARVKDVAALEAHIAQASRTEAEALRYQVDRFAELLLMDEGNPDTVIRSLERRLDAMSAAGPGRYYGQSLPVPDLVTLAGKDRAEKFLRRALVTPNLQLNVNENDATAKLARRLALELIQDLKVPQWDLTSSLDAVELYEAMQKKFAKPAAKAVDAPADAAKPAVNPDNLEAQLESLQAALNAGGGPAGESYSDVYQESQARTYYLLGLIVARRTADAVNVAESLGKERHIYLPPEALKELERAGHTKALDDFFHQLLTRNPALPFWDGYVQLAARAGTTARMVTLVRTAAARDDLSAKKRASIRQRLYAALLAADQVEEGATELRAVLAQKEEAPDVSGYTELRSHGDLGLALAQLGALLEQKEWFDEGVAAARAYVNKAVPGRDHSWDSTALSLAGLLEAQGRGAEAEAVLTEALVAQARARHKAAESHFDNTNERWILSSLAGLYLRAGRTADVLALFEQAPSWGARDLAEILTIGGSHFARMRMPVEGESSSGGSLGLIAADALTTAGRQAEARPIVDALLQQESGSDSVYELLIKLADNDALRKLDEVYAKDPFEERPLIWKALLLHRAKKFDEAETVARQAISIDPSDGEQGPGDRMRVYSVLADIREARNDAPQAKFFRDVVKAIRQSERADHFHAAGLLTRAIKMYQDSLKLFTDAYCVQSRLAVRMAELGRHAEAEAHYRKAYELMPDSFGRLESHCFGCERVFDGERAQSMAEKVFTELAAKTPRKPQVHYLLGYLREQQGRYAEALPHFQQAVKLDPDYLNAWKLIQDVGRRARLAPRDHDAAALQILRLDPLGRHVRPEFTTVSDLKALWNAVETAARLRPAKPSNLLPLTASRANVEKAERDGQGRRDGMGWRSYGSPYDESAQRLPGQVIAMNQTIAAAIGLMERNSWGGLEE